MQKKTICCILNEIKIYSTICALLLFYPTQLISQNQLERYQYKTSEDLIKVGNDIDFRANSASDILKLFYKSIDTNTYFYKIQNLFITKYQELENIDLVDSCNIIIDVGNFLTFEGQSAISLKLLFYLHTFLQNKPNKNSEEYLVLGRTKKHIGEIYVSLGIWSKASQYLNDVLYITENQSDKLYKAHALVSLASLFWNLNRYDEAKNNLNEAIQLYQEENFLQGLFYAYNGMGIVYHMQKNYLASIDYYSKAMEQLESDENRNAMFTILNNLGDAYTKINDLEAAHHYINLAKDYIVDHYDLITFYITKFEIFQKLNRKDSCEIYLNKYLTLSQQNTSYFTQTYLLKVTYEYYAQNKDYEKAYQYFLKYNTYRDSVDNINNEMNSEILQTISKISEIELKSSLLEQNLRFENQNIKQRLLVAYIATIALIISLALIILLHRARKREMITMTKNLEMSDQLIQKEKQLLLQSKIELTKEIEYKNRQLASSALQLVSFNQFIASIINKLQNTILSFKSHDSSKIKPVRTAINELRQYISGNNWDEFKLYFEEVHPVFYQNINKAFPSLTQNELKLCALIKLGLSNKEIASIIFREIRSIESARNRLRKKFGLQTNNSLFDFLSKF